MSDAEANSSLPAGPRPSALRWFQFRLRTLLAVVMLVAAALLAFRVYVEPYAQQRQALKVIERLGGRVVTAEAGPWQRRLLGADLVNITLIDLADCHQVDDYLPHVASLPCLETLVVGGEEFTDDHLRRLRLPKLTGLVLDSTAVTDKTLAEWQNEHAAVEVYQSDRQFIKSLAGDDPILPPSWDLRQNSFYGDLTELVGMEFFAELREPTFEVDDRSAELPIIPKLKNLQRLRLIVRGAGTRHVSVECLRPMRNLASLVLRGSFVTDNDVIPITTLPELIDLDLEDARVTDNGVSHLASIHNLRRLSLARTRVTDIGVARLTCLTGLTHLNLRGTRITNAGLQHVASLEELGTIMLGDTHVGDAGLMYLAGLTRLSALDLDRTDVTDAGLALCTSWPLLREFSLEGTAITNAGLTHLDGLKRLRYLHVRGTKATGEGIVRLLVALPGLHVRR